MSISPHRATSDPLPSAAEESFPVHEGFQPEPQFDQLSWTETRDEHEVASAGGRMVLGWALAVLALLWTGYTAWSAGRSLADQPLSSPLVAQWLAILAGPLALMGLVWLMFGRTRRKEAEQFTRSVIAMRTEARSLQDILAALSNQINENHAALGLMAWSVAKHAFDAVQDIEEDRAVGITTTAVLLALAAGMR